MNAQLLLPVPESFMPRLSQISDMSVFGLSLSCVVDDVAFIVVVPSL